MQTYHLCHKLVWPWGWLTVPTVLIVVHKCFRVSGSCPLSLSQFSHTDGLIREKFYRHALYTVYLRSISFINWTHDRNETTQLFISSVKFRKFRSGSYMFFFFLRLLPTKLVSGLSFSEQLFVRRIHRRPHKYFTTFFFIGNSWNAILKLLCSHRVFSAVPVLS